MTDSNGTEIKVGDILVSDIGTEICVSVIGRPLEYEENVVIGYVVDNIVVNNILIQSVLTEHRTIKE
jgi:hypothetical protein